MSDVYIRDAILIVLEEDGPLFASALARAVVACFFETMSSASFRTTKTEIWRMVDEGLLRWRMDRRIDLPGRPASLREQ